MIYDWQTLLILFTPILIMLAMVEPSDDDDDDGGPGLMVPAMARGR